MYRYPQRTARGAGQVADLVESPIPAPFVQVLIPQAEEVEAPEPSSEELDGVAGRDENKEYYDVTGGQGINNIIHQVHEQSFARQRSAS